MLFFGVLLAFVGVIEAYKSLSRGYVSKLPSKHASMTGLKPFSFINTPRSTLMATPRDSAPSQDGIEPKYIVALVVFLLACVYDKMVMHGGF